jgi:DNA-binding response OmpR family regulator
MLILIVEDERPMARILRKALEEHGHTIDIASSGQEALDVVCTADFDLIVLDVMLPGLNGLAVTRHLRQSGNRVPILILTARDSADDVVKGLDAGADDYLVKPFALNVLMARVRALARRSASLSLPELQVNDLVLNPKTGQVSRGGRGVTLRATEFRFLEHLMRRVGRVASRSSIIEAVWGLEHDLEPNTIDVYIKLLREKVDSDPDCRLIHTVRGYGYVLREG